MAGNLPGKKCDMEERRVGRGPVEEKKSHSPRVSEKILIVLGTSKKRKRI